MTALSDEDLLQQMIAGDEAAFTLLYRRRQPDIYRFALRMSGAASIAEDVTQEVFMVLIRDARRYDARRGPVSAYLYGVARNQVRRSLKKCRDHVSIPGENEGIDRLVDNGDPHGDLAQAEMIQSVRRAVLALPLRYREVVVLCDLSALSYAEAAAALGCPVGTIRSRLSRAHALLVSKLRESGASGSVLRRFHAARCLP